MWLWDIKIAQGALEFYWKYAVYNKKIHDQIHKNAYFMSKPLPKTLTSTFVWGSICLIIYQLLLCQL